MNYIEIFFNKIRRLMKDENIPFDEKSFYLTVMSAIPVSIFFVVVFCIIKNDAEFSILTIAMLLAFLALFYIVVRFEEVSFYKYIFIFLLNFCVFPTLFYITGDLYNGVIMFLTLGIIVTFFIVRRKSVYLLATLEFVWFFYIISKPMTDYESFNEYRQMDKLEIEIGLISCFVCASLIPIFIIFYQRFVYQNAHKKLLDAKQMMIDARQNKSRFLSNMTNEIRMPMNAIIGMNELISNEELDVESKEIVENIRNSSNQLLKIINNILEFSKLDSNRMEMYPQKYDFKKLISEIVDTVSREYASEDNEFYVEIDPNIPSVLFGDDIKIKQVFMYLLFSAVNKMAHSRISLSVKGDIDRNTNTVLIECSISESGLGLTETEIEAMLSAYTKFDSRQKTGFKSMGLEFSICKEILNMMGGNISIDSVEGVGISIKFEFINYIIEDYPIIKLSSVNEYSVLVYSSNEYDNEIWNSILSPFQIYPTIVYGPNAFRNAIENRRYTHIFIYADHYGVMADTINNSEIVDNVYIVTENGNIYSEFGKCRILRKPLNCINIVGILNDDWDEDRYKVAAKKEMVTYPEAKVLIVDDSLVNLKVLEGMLSTFKINITKAQSGIEALNILENEEFDMLILDQRMPQMDGIELFHHIKRLNNANALVPILCATADFGSEIARYLEEVGFSDYLAKPVRKFYLERMLRQFLPVELAVNIQVDVNSDTKQSHNANSDNKDTNDTGVSKEIVREDPLIVHFDEGCENVGGDLAAYGVVLLSFWKEGIDKLKKVPKLYENDMGLYVIEVHALKSSNAAIGARGMSTLFKELEFAGRASNREFIESHSAYAFEEFEKVLDIVKEYMIKNNLYVEEQNELPQGDVVSLDIDKIDEVINALAGFNLKLCEEKLKELVTINFGQDINSRIKSINDSYEMFDYHKVKDELNELKNIIS